MAEDELDVYWAEISQVFKLEQFCPPTLNLPANRPSVLSENTINYLVDNPDMASFVEDFILDAYNIQLREQVIPSFWKYFPPPGVEKTHQIGFEQFERAVTELYSDVETFIPGLQELSRLRHKCGLTGRSVFGETDINSLFKLYLKGSLHAQLPVHFQHLVRQFYSQAFLVFYNKADRDPDDSSEDLTCEGCAMTTDACLCSSITAIFNKVNAKLAEMDILERISSQVVTEIVDDRIHSHVQDQCKGSFDESYVDSLIRWLDSVVMGWVRSIHSCNPSTPAPLTFTSGKTAEMEEYRAKLLQFMYETYTKARIEQLFNIIIEFPESQPALEDLRDCIVHTDLRGHLTHNLRQVLDAKLLHPGVNTADILTAYIAAIRALRVLDGSGVVLELVCENVRRYLRTREDTVRCIVQSLLDDNATELTEELVKTEGLRLDESFQEEDASENWDTWEPDPVDADPNKTSRGRRSSDIISMLVNIYGSKELFVNEYRSLLSNRLLAMCSYDTDKEIRHLEMLKIRFGEAPLHQCEVMLKDIGDSKRINSHLHSTDGGCPELQTQQFPVNSIILSGQFWPQFKAETLELPVEVQESLEVYTKAFQTLKGNRTLQWKNHLGFANIDLEIGEKKINLTVSPIHAAIVYKFQEKEEWSAVELAASLKIPVSALRRKITFWMTQGILKETLPDQFQLVEEGPMRRPSGMVCDSHNQSIGGEDDGDDSVTASSRDQKEEELNVFWSYIVGMLTNLESLPLERIYQMLRMFAMQGPSAVECEVTELRAFLDNKVRQHKLAVSGGQYRLPKP